MTSNNKLYVGNLSYGTQNNDLQEFFAQAGDVVEAVIIMDRMTDRSRGFGFVTMGSDGDLEKALELNGQELDGRPLRVNKAERPAGGGGRGGRGGDRGGRGGNGGGGRWGNDD